MILSVLETHCETLTGTTIIKRGLAALARVNPGPRIIFAGTIGPISRFTKIIILLPLDATLSVLETHCETLTGMTIIKRGQAALARVNSGPRIIFALN